jgi:hypothetical protein
LLRLSWLSIIHQFLSWPIRACLDMQLHTMIDKLHTVFSCFVAQ